MCSFAPSTVSSLVSSSTNTDVDINPLAAIVVPPPIVDDDDEMAALHTWIRVQRQGPRR